MSKGSKSGVFSVADSGLLFPHGQLKLQRCVSGQTQKFS